jgi:hypothetical protein
VLPGLHLICRADVHPVKICNVLPCTLPGLVNAVRETTPRACYTIFMPISTHACGRVLGRVGVPWCRGATLRSHLTTVVASHDRGGGGGGLAHASLVSVVATAITVFVRKARITIVIPICVDQVHVVHGSNTSMYCTSPPSQDVNQKWQLTNVQTQNACMHVCVCMCVYACVRLRECLCVCVCARARSFTYMCGYVFLCAHGRRRTRLCAGMVT